MNGIAAISDLKNGLGAHPSVAQLLGVLAISLLGIGVAFAICAFFIQLFARILFGYWPSFRNAFWTTFASALIGLGVGLVLCFFLGFPPVGANAIILRVAQVVVQTVVIGAVLEHPDTENGKLGIPKAALLVGAQLVVGFCLGMAIFFVLPAGAKSAFLKARAKQQAALVSAPAHTAPAAPLIGAPPVTKPSTIEEAQREAVRRYPDLGVAGSTFNREFRARYDRYRQTNPKYFLETNWPISLAEETDAALKSR